MVTEFGSAQTADLERATAKKPEAGSQAISHSHLSLRPSGPTETSSISLLLSIVTFQTEEERFGAAGEYSSD
jgi:hypothetical protein